jgi:hypothetical protein
MVDAHDYGFGPHRQRTLHIASEGGRTRRLLGEPTEVAEPRSRSSLSGVTSGKRCWCSPATPIRPPPTNASGVPPVRAAQTSGKYGGCRSGAGNGTGGDVERLDGVVDQAAATRSGFSLPLHASMFQSGASKAHPILYRHTTPIERFKQFEGHRNVWAQIGDLTPVLHHTQQYRTRFRGGAGACLEGFVVPESFVM